MGRFIVYSLILALSVFLISSAVVLRRGGGSSEAVMQVSVHDLISGTERFIDQRVTTFGVLQRMEAPEEHFVLEDSEFRIGIVGFEVSALRALEGQKVTVVGRFDVEEGIGRRIEVEAITLVE